MKLELLIAILLCSLSLGETGLGAGAKRGQSLRDSYILSRLHLTDKTLLSLLRRVEVLEAGRLKKCGVKGLLGKPSDPVQNCQVLKKTCPALPSGNYWLDIDLNGPLAPFLGYCDMTTEGGGWTLAWSFTFNNYNKFTSGNNYIKPVPRNMYSSAPVISQTPPKSETDYNAIDFLNWKKIGSEFLVKSNINNWVACVPGSGSLVTKTTGTLNCRLTKKIVLNSNCVAVPRKLSKDHHGFSLDGKSLMYYFEKSKVTHSPTHDPCANNQSNHLKNIPNPHSNVYIR